MGPLDGTLGDVPCVHLSRCTRRSGMFSIHGKVSPPGGSSVGLVKALAPFIQPHRTLVKNHRGLLDDVGRRKWDRLPPGRVPRRCGVLPVVRHSGLLGAAPRVRALGTCGEPSRPCHIRALGTCGTGLRRCRCASCAVVLTPAGVLSTLVLSSPSLFRRGWPPPGLSPPCVRALGTCRRGLMCLLGAFSSQPGQSCGRWSPRQMRPVARMRLHLCVRPQLPGQRPRIHRTGSLSDRWPLACYCPWKPDCSAGGAYLSLCSQACPWTSPCPWTCSCPSGVVRSPWMTWSAGGPWRRS